MKTKIRSLLFSTLALIVSGVPPGTQAVTPPPDGGYPGGNTAEGQNALLSLTNGTYNTAVGVFSLETNAEGNFNTAIGAGTLLANTGDENTATGAGALLSNTIGLQNTSDGAFALFSNTTGNDNVATGFKALFANTDGIDNSAFGVDALGSNTTGNFNAAVGGETLYSNTTGIFNTSMGGYRALFHNTNGESNTGIGAFALFNNATGDNNTALGKEAGENITGNGNICIGAAVLGEASVNNRTYIRNINTTTQSFSAGVNDYVTVRLTDGRLGHTQVVSSRRYKEEIKLLAAASETLYALKPVSFRLKKEYDETRALGFGLIAEEVEKVDPALVYRNNKGLVESVRYEMVNAMLLNEFLKEHGKVQALEAIVGQQQKAIQTLAARLKEHDSRIQKVTDKIEMSRAAPELVATDQ